MYHMLGMGVGTGAEVDVCILDIQILKKWPGHVVIIMLAGDDFHFCWVLSSTSSSCFANKLRLNRSRASLVAAVPAL